MQINTAYLKINLLYRFSYVLFGKQWLGPSSPRWSKLLRVAGVRGHQYSWSVFLTQVIIADDHGKPLSGGVHDLAVPLKVMLDTGALTDND